jgi:hypothetical protein
MGYMLLTVSLSRFAIQRGVGRRKRRKWRKPRKNTPPQVISSPS